MPGSASARAHAAIFPSVYVFVSVYNHIRKLGRVARCVCMGPLLTFKPDRRCRILIGRSAHLSTLPFLEHHYGPVRFTLRDSKSSLLALPGQETVRHARLLVS